MKVGERGFVAMWGLVAAAFLGIVLFGALILLPDAIQDWQDRTDNTTEYDMVEVAATVNITGLQDAGYINGIVLFWLVRR